MSPETVNARPAEDAPAVDGASLPFLGTTWLRRGPAYVWRRFVLVLLLLACFAAAGSMVAGLLVALHSQPAIWFYAAIGVVALVTVGTVRQTWRSTRPSQWAQTKARHDRQWVELARLLRPSVLLTAALGLLLVALVDRTIFSVLILAAFAGFGVAAFGPALVYLVRGFGREVVVERYARTRLGVPRPGAPGRARWLDEHLAPAGPSGSAGRE